MIKSRYASSYCGRASKITNKVNSRVNEAAGTTRRIYKPSINSASSVGLVGSYNPRTPCTRHLFGFGQPNCVVAKVIDAVPFAQERVTQNGQWADGLGEVHAHEAADAGALDL